MSEVLSNQPVEKRHSLLEDPDIGEVWPTGFDAITVRQQETRHFKAKEARRFIEHFFSYDVERRQDHLKGVILHRQDTEYEAVVMFDTNRPYMRARLLGVPILGNKEYGYRVEEEPRIVQHDKGYVVAKEDLLTYFSVPVGFEAIQGEILGMMVAEARDEVIRRNILTLPIADQSA